MDGDDRRFDLDKNKHITNDKRIALSIVEQNNPFNMVSIKGKVIEQTTEGADEDLIRLKSISELENISTGGLLDPTGKVNGTFDPSSFLFFRIFSTE